MSTRIFMGPHRRRMSRQILSTLLPRQKMMMNSNLLSPPDERRPYSPPHPHPNSSKALTAQCLQSERTPIFQNLQRLLKFQDLLEFWNISNLPRSWNALTPRANFNWMSP